MSNAKQAIVKAIAQSNSAQAAKASQPVDPMQQLLAALVGKVAGSHGNMIDAASDLISRTGEKIIVPDSIPLPQAIEVLKEQVKYEEKEVSIRETISGCFWDGAYAFMKAMKEKFGWTHAEPKQTMFGPRPPELRSIASGVDTTVLVPWGQFSVPGVEGMIETSYTHDAKGRLLFVINGTVKRKHEAVIRDLAERARRIVKDESLYRGKAVRIAFTDDDGDNIDMFEPQFMDVSKINPASLILPAAVKEAVETSVFTPLLYTAACRANKIPLKRGILLSGLYGTGKTLTASVASRYAEDNGWTFVYCEKAADLNQAVRFAHAYQPCVIFCEDVDRVTDGDRDEAMDEILNIVDGIESKGTEIMIVLTTNAVESIDKAMLRPGRLDAIINFTAPDAQAVQQLIRHYGGKLVAEDADLASVGETLAGRIPAVIRECVERAKLSAIKTSDGTSIKLTTAALLDAANGMQHQLALLSEGVAPLNKFEQLGRSFVNVLRDEDGVDVESVAKRVKDIHERFCQ